MSNPVTMCPQPSTPIAIGFDQETHRLHGELGLAHDTIAALRADLKQLQDWRDDVCEYAGLSTAAGAQWSVQQLVDCLELEAMKRVGNDVRELIAACRECAAAYAAYPYPRSHEQHVEAACRIESAEERRRAALAVFGVEQESRGQDANPASKCPTRLSPPSVQTQCATRPFAPYTGTWLVQWADLNGAPHSCVLPTEDAAQRLVKSFCDSSQDADYQACQRARAPAPVLQVMADASHDVRILSHGLHARWGVTAAQLDAARAVVDELIEAAVWREATGNRCREYWDADGPHDDDCSGELIDAAKRADERFLTALAACFAERDGSAA